MHRCPRGASSASEGEKVGCGVTHRIGRVLARMCFDPGDRQVVMLSNNGEEAPDSLDEGLVTARFDGVVPEKSNAVLAVCEQVDAPPGTS